MNPEAPEHSPARYHGQVAYIYAFDLAYEMRREPIEQVLGRTAESYAIGPGKRGPKYYMFYRPQRVDLPPWERRVHGRPVEIRLQVKLFSIGAMSIRVCVPFEDASISDLVAYHDLELDGASLEQEVAALAEQLRQALLPHCIRPVERLRVDEAYTVFCLHGLPAEGSVQAPRAEDWLAAHRREVAGLLTQEEDAALLSDQEASESTGHYLSYYDSDLVVPDWDAALVVHAPEGLDEILHVMELANVQLAELAAYDLLLDGAVDAAYRDMRQRARSRTTVRRGLREIRIDMARLADELGNITKFFGDWHLARIYQQLSERFHLSDWQRTVEEKSHTLEELYEILERERSNLWMVVLEATIVGLFVLDVVLLLLSIGSH
ncbi:MAG: hypothetical protein JXR96_20825 [Deltaproteobacteria bacterium]|nr:hypothetical protein [Deltaproteobacteria bacterium]